MRSNNPLSETKPESSSEIIANLIENPDSSFWNGQAAAHFRAQGNTALAIKYALRAIEIEPDNPINHISLSIYRREMGQNDEAENAVREAIRLDPSNPVARFEHGLVLQERGKTQDALREYRTCLDLMSLPRTVDGYYEDAHNNVYFVKDLQRMAEHQIKLIRPQS